MTRKNNTLHRFPKVSPQPSFPKEEEKILAFWKEENIFEETLKKPDADEFVFYDGPPFANGLPHYGHLLTGFIKDIIPRYKTMQGYKSNRRFGWDCHGLPAEMEVEKNIGVSGQQAIKEYGIEKFNAECLHSVLKYTKEWESFVKRQARWVDFENDYKTLDLPYMESVMWAFSSLYEKGLIYEGYKVVPYSWACQTVLSLLETRLDNAYRNKQDPALSVKLRLTDDENRFLVIWTTTPWTLPSNLAVAVGKEIEYVDYRLGDETLVIAASAVERYARELEGGKVIRQFTGDELVGLSYEPPFPYFKEFSDKAFHVLHGEFVTTEDGTGLVHCASGFGEEDQRLCEAHGIGVVCPVDDAGCFTSEVKDYEGMQVFEANKPIIQFLKSNARVLRHETIDHSYPHCWRTDTPLIYKAVSCWYVKVTEIRDRMVELNQQIKWVPDHIKDGQFGKWLENARDWAISRTRFWGSPIPVWKSDNPDYPRVDVYGSVEQLEADFGVSVTDLHRPFIDELTRPNPDDPSGKSIMRRVPEVLDCWFESGSMPFAQLHYPFENKEHFEQNFPADFIVEYVAQTRGWFYTLMVLSTALFDRPPFLNCICHGVVLDEDGKKLSKRLKNYPSPEEVYATHGADALRWYLVSSPIVRGGDLSIDAEGKGIAETVRSVLNPLWSAYYFFTLYAESDQITPVRGGELSEDVLDRYILSKLRILIDSVEESLDGYDLAETCGHVLSFIQALNNWYIRRSRERFWKGEKDAHKQAAYDTLYTVLVHLCEVTAPLLPLISETIFKGLTGERSVHLQRWPSTDTLPSDQALVRAMDRVREVCSIGLSLRESKRLRTRLPLGRLMISGPDSETLQPYQSLIMEELNVKTVEFSSDIEHCADFVLKVNSRKVGPRMGKKMKDVLGAARLGNWSTDPENPSVIVIGEERLSVDEYELKLVPKEGITALATYDKSMIVALDTELTQDLLDEGIARDLVRVVQQARKDADFHVADRILVHVQLPSEQQARLTPFLDYIQSQTLSNSVEFGPIDDVHASIWNGHCTFTLGDDTHGILALRKL